MRRIEIATLVVKVASRCNMDCDYCYIYHGEDRSWENMTTTISPTIVDALSNEIYKLYQIQQTKPQIVFHGGEPLLIGISRLRAIVTKLVHLVPNVSLSIQTNGTIYSDSLEQLLLEYRNNLSFSISVDGFQAENDRHRLGRRQQSVYSRVESTLMRARQAGVLDNILMVIDIQNDPARIYQFMLEAGAGSYNILLEDGDYDHLPLSKRDTSETNVGRWLCSLFNLYSSGSQNFRIKFFDDIALSLLKKVRGAKVPPATYSLCTITIDTNGEIKQADTFRINSNGADRLTGRNIVESSLFEVANSPSNRASLEEVEDLATRCIECSYLDSCGGGFPPHRAKKGNFRNPSIYCADYMHLFERIENALCH